jgi:hypothetical protein
LFGSLVKNPTPDRIIPYCEISGLVRFVVEGRAGRFVPDEIGGSSLLNAVLSL